MRISHRILGFSGIAALIAIGSSCNLDPVHRSSVNALGPESAADYPTQSEYHRPGEPCGLCHSDKGPADTVFALGGTVFWGPDAYDKRVDKAYVRILDGHKGRRCFVTNCNGNFYIKKEDFEGITFPILISVERAKDPGGKDPTSEQSLALRPMSSHIGRDPSCATCHIQGLRDYGSPGQIHIFDSDADFTASGQKIVDCPPPADYQVLTLCPEDRN